jgi:hypothetical protein
VSAPTRQPAAAAQQAAGAYIEERTASDGELCFVMCQK